MPDGYGPIMSASSLCKPMEALSQIARSVIELAILLNANTNVITIPFPENIRLQDKLKTSFVFFCRRCLQDVLIKTNYKFISLRDTPSEDIHKTS